MRLKAIALGVALALGGILVAACGGGLAPSPSSPAAAAAGEAQLAGPAIPIQIRGQQQVIANGGAVEVGGLVVEIFFNPFPPKRLTTLDLYLVERAARQPVQGAAVSFQFDHDVMNHGPFAQQGIPREPGHYLAPFDFLMVGAGWWMNINIDRGGEDYVINVLFDVVR